jgi:hypothetical protein
MQLTEQESRVAIAALQMLEKYLAEGIEPCAALADTEALEPQSHLSAQHRCVTNLTRKLATTGDHEVDAFEVALTIRGLDRYSQLLAESFETNAIEGEDLQWSPEMKGRTIELHRSAQLLDKLGASSRLD